MNTQVNVLETYMAFPRMSLYELHKRIWKQYMGGMVNREERDYLFRFAETANHILVTLRTDETSCAAFPFRQRLSMVSYAATPGTTHIFDIRVVPVVREKHKVIRTIKNDEAAYWFAKKAQQNGFKISKINDSFSQGRVFHGARQRRITLNDTFIQGELEVTDYGLFHDAICKGIGRHKGLGFGMLNLHS